MLKFSMLSQILSCIQKLPEKRNLLWNFYLFACCPNFKDAFRNYPKNLICCETSFWNPNAKTFFQHSFQNDTAICINCLNYILLHVNRLMISCFMCNNILSNWCAKTECNLCALWKYFLIIFWNHVISFIKWYLMTAPTCWAKEPLHS